VSRWEILAVQVAADDAAKLPAHEAEQLATLQGHLLDARQIGVRQEAARSEFRRLGNELRALARTGDGVRSRLGASLKSRLGFSAAEHSLSEQLPDFVRKAAEYDPARTNQLSEEAE
jgi:hypothetical protein